VVASLALATDLAMGHPMEQGLGSCILATRLGELVGLSTEDLRRTFHLALLRHIGCTTENHSFAALIGDEIAMSGAMAPLSGGKRSEYARTMLRLATGGKPPQERVAAVVRMAAGMRQFNAVNVAICEVAQMLGSRLGLDDELVRGLGVVYERWDGKGLPGGVRGEAIPLPVRVSQVTDLAAVLHDEEHESPGEVIRSRAGGGFDPDVVEVFVRHERELFAELDVASRWEAVLKLEPGGPELLGEERVDDALAVMADFADLKSPFLVGHSSGVAALAGTAARRLGLPAADVGDVRRAGLVHDLGRISVSAGVWGRRGPLTAGQWEGVRLHPYHTERVLGRAPFLARLAAIASLHHERLDGSGYFRGAGAHQMAPAARVLAAADAFHAMTEPRPHRPALPPDRAANELLAAVRAGRLDRESADAVLEAAGRRATRRKEHVAGLTAREVEVLRLVARGLSTRQVGRTLGISAKTTDNHIQSIYAKAGVTTRAAATVFAMQHGLMDPLGS
jgi:HD-GYP domain-containing protein (c-di-GMP phosphodiesterase class II)